MSLHCWRGSLRPAATTVHWPGEPDEPQVWQAPSQALSQQNPSTQKPDWHSPAAPQVAPIGFFPHEPCLQTFGETQSVSLAH